MTFEEFFIKKKIDLPSLEKGDAPLYREFRSHFALMGEKSFDHSKKYWFNKLRKQYALREEEAVSVAQKKGMDAEVPGIDSGRAIAEQETPQAARPTGFKPRFKAVQAKSPAADTKPEEQGAEMPKTGEEASPVPAKPTGFKPRFKAAMLNKQADGAGEEKPVENVAPTESDGKAPVTSGPKAPDGETETPSKPKGFTPRFKAGVTKPATAAVPEEQKAPENPTEKTEGPGTGPVKPLGFKPRFAKKASDPAPEERPKTVSADMPGEEKESTAPPATDQAEQLKPLGFKPRFKAKPAEGGSETKSD